MRGRFIAVSTLGLIGGLSVTGCSGDVETAVPRSVSTSALRSDPTPEVETSPRPSPVGESTSSTRPLAEDGASTTAAPSVPATETTLLRGPSTLESGNYINGPREQAHYTLWLEHGDANHHATGWLMFLLADGRTESVGRFSTTVVPGALSTLRFEDGRTLSFTGQNDTIVVDGCEAMLTEMSARHGMSCRFVYDGLTD